MPLPRLQADFFARIADPQGGNVMTIVLKMAISGSRHYFLPQQVG